MANNAQLIEKLDNAETVLRQKIESSREVWNDQVGIAFQENVQSGVLALAKQFAKELEALENFISQARSKVP